MKAMTYSEYGTTDVIRLEELETPVPTDHQVLIKVRAASINDWDWGLIRGETTNRLFNGWFRPKKFLIPGCDVAGSVEAVGNEVTTFKPGDDVYGDLCATGFGAFAEYVCTNERSLAHKPASMTFEQAAAIPQAGMLAYQGLFDVIDIRNGKRKILLNGAGGGVGTFALQLLKPYDAEVTCVDSRSKLDMLRELGSDHVIDYQKQDFTRLSQLYDLILDARTNRSPYAYLRVLKPGGTYATVGGQNLRLLETFLLQKLIAKTHQKHVRVVGLKANRNLVFFNEQFDAGNIVPVIDGPYPFSDVVDAFKRFALAEHQGKIVITIS